MIAAIATVLLLLSSLSPAVAQNSSLIATGATPVHLQSGFKFSEGPVADARGNIYFTDVPRSVIHILTVKGDISVFRTDTNGANGLDFDNSGNLIACEGRADRLTAQSPGGKLSVLADAYDGRKLNSPNDVWVDPKGGIYFTDPHFGKLKNRSQDGGHVYYLGPDRVELKRVTSDLKQPNGIVGSEDGKRLYVSDNKLSAIFEFDVSHDGSLGPKRKFSDDDSDGMTLDENGNVYLTWYGGVRIYDTYGRLLDTVDIPGFASNVAFGGADGRTLFITAKEHLYSIEMTVTGARNRQ